MRLDKFLTEVQIGSRSQVKDYIKKGRISVNQVTVLKPEAQIKENSDTVTFDGKELQYSQFHYYMLHKPAGVITAVKDDKDVTVMSLLPRDAGRNLSPVGRLDKDTEGLLLITNDGELSHRLLSPKKHVAKTYYVECRGGISESKLEMLRKGVDIGDDKMTLPAQAELIQQDADSGYCCCFRITSDCIQIFTKCCLIPDKPYYYDSNYCPKDNGREFTYSWNEHCRNGGINRSE